MPVSLPAPSVDRFALRLRPDGVYFVEGRVIPVRDESSLALDNGEAVVRVHDRVDPSKDLGWGVLGVQIE